MTGVFILCALATLLCLVSCCEKETHYLKNDKCCKMCGPGKRMLVDDNCEDPRCQDCPEGEYQSGYTSKTMCERQPSCDTNLYFQPQINPSKTELIKCVCEPGYYCTQNDDCDTCRKHTVCKPGQRVIKKGSADSDTVCEACKNGTFSTHDSADTCKEWTVCEYGYAKNAPANSTSDWTCLDGTPTLRVAIGVGVVVLLVIVGVAVYFYLKKNNGCIEWQKQARKRYMTKLDQDADAERATIPIPRQPEEDDDSTPVSPTLSNVTENGYPVQQEHGKESVRSHPESNSIF